MLVLLFFIEKDNTYVIKKAKQILIHRKEEK